MDRKNTKNIALGGVLAAVCLVAFSLGGLIPFATYVCPTLAIMVLNFVCWFCGCRLAWAWYGAVAILGLLISPDKESGLLFLLLGYYPIIRTKIQRFPLSWIWKLMLFNGNILLLYGAMLRLMGLYAVLEEWEGFGFLGLVIMLILGNAVFVLLDMVLQRMDRKFGRTDG